MTNFRSTARDEGIIERGREALLRLLAGLDIAAWRDLHVWRVWPGGRRTA